MSIAEKLTTIAENQQKVYDAGVAAGQAEGYEQGKIDTMENLPVGYLKVDPTWEIFSYLCQNRPSIVASLKYSDTANGTNFVSMFQQCDVTSIPSLDLRKGTNFNGMFAYSSKIQEIGEIDISKATSVSNMFLSCSGLKRVYFAPSCIKVSIAFAQSRQLEDAAIQSIIDGLADLTGKETQTLAVHQTVRNAMTAEQVNEIVNVKNWTLAPAESTN